MGKGLDRKLRRANYREEYHNPKFQKRMQELYDESPNYQFVTRNLNKEFGTNISSVYVADLLKKNPANAIINNEEEKAFFQKSLDQMKERWNKAWQMVDDLIALYNKMKSQIENLDDSAQTLAFIKFTPTVLQLVKEMREQLDFIGKQQEQLSQQLTDSIMTPTELNQKLLVILKQMQDDGKIILLNPDSEISTELQVTQVKVKQTKKKKEEPIVEIVS